LQLVGDTARIGVGSSNAALEDRTGRNLGFKERPQRRGFRCRLRRAGGQHGVAGDELRRCPGVL
jgi:hypothetical protein